jgi:hypothetical protein
MVKHPNPVWLKADNERQSSLYRRMKELHRTNLHFKNTLDVLEASLDVMEAVLKVRSEEEDLKLRYNDIGMFHFRYEKSWISHFSNWLPRKNSLSLGVGCQIKEETANKQPNYVRKCGIMS